MKNVSAWTIQYRQKQNLIYDFPKSFQRNDIKFFMNIKHNKSMNIESPLLTPLPSQVFKYTLFCIFCELDTLLFTINSQQFYLQNEHR